jgi:hypothetical protein
MQVFLEFLLTIVRNFCGPTDEPEKNTRNADSIARSVTKIIEAKSLTGYVVLVLFIGVGFHTKFNNYPILYHLIHTTGC